MPAIRIGAALLDLDGSTQVALERNSPLLAPEGERGSATLPIKIPKTDHNNRTLGFPDRFDHRSGGAPQQFEAELLNDNGGLVQAGTFKYRGSDERYFLYNLEFGTSYVMGKLKARMLNSFIFGGVRQMEPAAGRRADAPDDYLQAICDYMMETVTHPENHDVVFAPFSNDDANGGWDKYVSLMESYTDPDPIVHSVTFNQWGEIFSPAGNSMGFGYTIPFVVIGPRPDGTVAACPLPKLQYVVPNIFREMRLPLETDIFTDSDFSKLYAIPANSVALISQYLGEEGRIGGGQFRIGDHLPDLNAAEYLRGLMDTFGWYFDVTPAGVCRLLKSAPLIKYGTVTDITSLVGPSLGSEVVDRTTVHAKNLIADNDRYAQEFAAQPEPESLVNQVTYRAQLVPPVAPDRYCLVASEARYYRSIGTDTTDTNTQTTTTVYTWEPGPHYLPDVLVGSGEGEEEYTVGVAITLDEKVNARGTLGATVTCPMFMEPSYTPDYSGAPRSKTIRLAFFRGVVDVPGVSMSDGGQATWPLLTSGNLALDGNRVGNYTLHVHGQYGLVKQHLQPLLAMKAATRVLRFPSYFSIEQFNRLDLTRPVAIRGDHFMLQSSKMTLPQTKAGVIQVVSRRDVDTAQLQLGEILTCDLDNAEVEIDGTTATITVDGKRGVLSYTISGRPAQSSNVFEGLTPGTTYSYTIADDGLAGCELKGEFTIEAEELVCSLDEVTVDIDGSTATLSVTGGQGAISYVVQGFPPQANGVFANLTRGQSYSYTIIDDVVPNCQKTGDFYVPYSCDLVLQGITFEGLSATINVAGAHGDLFYTVDGRTQMDDNVFTGLVGGSDYTYSVVDNEVENCELTGSFTVPEVECTLGLSTPYTSNTVAVLFAAYAKGELTYVVQGFPPQSSNTFSGLTRATTYSYTIIDAGATNCSRSGTFRTTDVGGDEEEPV